MPEMSDYIDIVSLSLTVELMGVLIKKGIIERIEFVEMIHRIIKVFEAPKVEEAERAIIAERVAYLKGMLSKDEQQLNS